MANINVNIEMTETTRSYYGNVLAAIDTVNDAIADDKYSEIATAKTAANEALATLNASVIKDAFDRFLDENNPVLAAITAGYVPLYAIKTERNKMTGTESVSLSVKENNVVDIVALEKYSKRKLFVNGRWPWWIEAFKNGLYNKVIEDVGTPAQKKKFFETFKISEAAKSCDMGANPSSYKSLTKAMQAIFDSVLFVAKDDTEEGKKLNKWKVDTRDVKYIIYLAFKRGKSRLSIAMPQDATIVNLMVEVMHRNVTNAEFVFEN